MLPHSFRQFLRRCQGIIPSRFAAAVTMATAGAVGGFFEGGNMNYN